MKKNTLLVLCLFLCCMVYAQNKNFKKSVKQSVKSLTALYHLDKFQTEKVFNIQKEYVDNLEQIASLQANDPERYFRKRRSIRHLSDGALKRLLNDEQLQLFTEQVQKRRAEEAAIRGKLKEGALDQREVWIAMADLY